MDIRFIFDESDPIPLSELQLGGDAEFIINKTILFIEHRLKVLEDLMNKEPAGFIVVDIGKPQIRYYYSKELAVKMMDSILESDFSHEMIKIYYALNQQ